MLPSSNPNEEEAFFLQERLNLLKQWEPLARELKGLSHIPPETIDRILPKIDDYIANLKAFDKDLEGL